MLTVCCVLRSGGDYGWRHVRHLRAGVRKWLFAPFRFVVLTDMQDDYFICEPLIHGWPGWFSKIEMFRPGLFPGETLYFDLDSVIVGPLDHLVTGHRFTVLRNMWVEPGHPRIGSGLMAWRGDLSAIYEAFRVDPARHMAECVTKDRWGDQGFIQWHAPVPMERWQDKHPGAVVSWKRGVLPNHGRVPADASIVVFHGLPRPWTTSLWNPADAGP